MKSNKQSLKLRYNKSGVVHILLLLLAVAALVAGGLYYFYNAELGKSNLIKMDNEAFIEVSDDTSNPPEAKPLSDSTDLDTIEAELDAIITGSPDLEIEAMGEDASSL